MLRSSKPESSRRQEQAGTEQTKAEQQFDKLEAQREFSKQVASVLASVVKLESHYPGATDGVDIGSYYRGTNLDSKPDVDVMFLNVPTENPYFDWTKINTYDTESGELASIGEVEALDQRMAGLIVEAEAALEKIGDSVEFNWLRCWGSGMAINFTLNHAEHGRIEVDLNFYFGDEYFGVDHAQRFNDYIDNVKQEFGSERAVELLEDIKQLKTQLKDMATKDGKLDKTKKVPGLIAESLFTNSGVPLSYDELVVELKDLWQMLDDYERPDKIKDQEEQLVSGFDQDSTRDVRATILKVLTSPALSKGGYESLKEILSSE